MGPLSGPPVPACQADETSVVNDILIGPGLFAFGAFQGKLGH
jgi:hypothetical protein